MTKINFKIWRGLAAVLAGLFGILLFMTSLAFLRAGDINTFLNITPPSALGTADKSTIYFPSAYANESAMIEAEAAHFVRVQEEGSVLLRNENAALPLSSSQRNVTLFGRAATDPVYKGAAGGAMVGSDRTSFEDALKAESFSVNNAALTALKSGITAAGSRTKSSIAEVASSTYSGISFDGYKNAAIVVLSRLGGEERDLQTNVKSGGTPMLALQKEEKEMFEIVKNGGFEKIIVLLNTGYAMDLGALSNYNVDACLWIGFPGRRGFTGVANILVGKSDPSGRLVDTYATDSMSSPAMRNFMNYDNEFTFTNLTANDKKAYLIYAEGIYVGYKYYETRYHDQVLNRNNAASAKGAFVNSAWDYAAEMVYTFGSGNSYARFSQEIVDIIWDRENNKVDVEVEVEHLGAAAGSSFDDSKAVSKEVVQLYVQLPYETGHAEKSAIQLAGYAKTPYMKTGDKQTVTFSVDDYMFATYDEKAVNGADTTKKGCYTFDEGDYYFALGANAHDALNNVLAARKAGGESGIGTLFDEDGNTVTGNAELVVKETLDTLDNISHAASLETGEVVCNQLQDVNINYYLDKADEITYLTRDNWNTYPESIKGLTATAEISYRMEGATYAKPANAPDISGFKHSQAVTVKFVELKDIPYSGKFTDADGNEQDADKIWETFLDQLTPAQLSQIPGERMSNAAITSIGYPATTCGDGPDGLMYTNRPHPCGVLIASTYNTELMRQRGEFLGEAGLYANQVAVYGPGANMHRTPYGGRNFEYMSEDATVSYYTCAYMVNGSGSKGFLMMPKHFAGNDQEENRHGSATFMTEQTLRQNALKAFEGAFTKGEALGTMTCYNRIGAVPGGAYYPVMTQVLRNEWGFKGNNITDSSKDAAHYMYTAESMHAGTDQFNNDPSRSDEIRKILVNDKDGYLWGKAREMAKHFFYAHSRTFATNGLTPSTEVSAFIPWWQPALIVLVAVVGVLAAGCIVMFVLSAFTNVFKKKQEEAL